MKKQFFVLIYLISLQIYAQKKYSFDYALIYSDSVSKTTITYLVNSKLNNYNLSFNDEKNKQDISFIFADYNGILINSKTPKAQFFKAETIHNPCENIFRYRSKNLPKSDEYEFVTFKDTLLNDSLYYHFAIKSIKSIEYQKRKKIKSCHFIVYKQSENEVPFLYHPTIYYKWVIKKNITNGFPKVIYEVDIENKVTAKKTLQKILKTKRFLTIPNKCDYTNPEIWNNRSNTKTNDSSLN